jgi:hypothetical protein
MTNAIRDNNHVTVALGVSSTDATVTLPFKVDPSTGRLLTDAAAGGYTNLTQFVDQTPWRIFYSNGSGDVTELALGADGTYLKSNGASAAPTWASVAGTGTVTSVAMTVPTGLTISGSPVTTTGTLAVALDTGYVIPLQSTLDAKAPLASPTFTGTVTIPTPFTLGAVSVTSTGTQLNYLSAATGTTGTTSTNIVFSTSPTLVTPVLGVATATSINGLTITSTTGTLTMTNGKTLAVTNTLTFSGTDSTVMTFPTTSKTIAANDGSNWTFTSQAIGDLIYASSATAFTRLAAVAVGSVLASAGTGTAPAWSSAPQITSIELGHATDTTITRSAAGVIAVEGVVIPSISSTNTLTNKRITKRVGTTTSSATPTINTDNVDYYSLTAQTADITSFTTNLSGTPTDGQTLWISITGTAARAITWGTSFEASTVALPTTTVTTNRLDVGFVWNAATSKWRCIASA